MPLCTSNASNDLRIMSKVFDGSLVNCLHILYVFVLLVAIIKNRKLQLRRGGVVRKYIICQRKFIQIYNTYICCFVANSRQVQIDAHLVRHRHGQCPRRDEYDRRPPDEYQLGRIFIIIMIIIIIDNISSSLHFRFYYRRAVLRRTTRRFRRRRSSSGIHVVVVDDDHGPTAAIPVEERQELVRPHVVRDVVGFVRSARFLRRTRRRW